MNTIERNKTIWRIVIFSVVVNAVAWIAPTLGGSPSAPGSWICPLGHGSIGCFAGHTARDKRLVGFWESNLPSEKMSGGICSVSWLSLPSCF